MADDDDPYQTVTAAVVGICGTVKQLEAHELLSEFRSLSYEAERACTSMERILEDFDGPVTTLNSSIKGTLKKMSDGQDMDYIEGSRPGWETILTGCISGPNEMFEYKKKGHSDTGMIDLARLRSIGRYEGIMPSLEEMLSRLRIEAEVGRLILARERGVSFKDSSLLDKAHAVQELILYKQDVIRAIDATRDARPKLKRVITKATNDIVKVQQEVELKYGQIDTGYGSSARLQLIRDSYPAEQGREFVTEAEEHEHWDVCDKYQDLLTFTFDKEILAVLGKLQELLANESEKHFLFAWYVEL